MFARSDTEVYVAGSLGEEAYLAGYNGQGWTYVPMPGFKAISAVFSNGFTWVIADGKVYRGELWRNEDVIIPVAAFRQLTPGKGSGSFRLVDLPPEARGASFTGFLERFPADPKRGGSELLLLGGPGILRGPCCAI